MYDVDFKQRVAVGERLCPVATETAAKGSRRVLKGLHEVETAEGHGAFQAGFGGNVSRVVLVLFRDSPDLPPLVCKWSVAASTAFI